jgi:Uma2 family endonuclease
VRSPDANHGGVDTTVINTRRFIKIALRKLDFSGNTKSFALCVQGGADYTARNRVALGIPGMNTLAEIRHAIAGLSFPDREAIATWLQAFTEAGYWGDSVQEPRSAYAASLSHLLTVEEYFALEARSQLRHEYVNGMIYAMTGASMAHNLVISEMMFVIKKHLRAGPCKAFSEGLKLHLKIGADEMFYYPDVMVACDREGWDTHYIHNPKLVVEVLSPSTQRTDVHEKALSYRRLASLEEYVIAAQDEPRLAIHRRAENWVPQWCVGPDAVARFRSIGLSVPLADIYEPALAP